MTRYKMINNELVEYTADELTALEAKEKAWLDEAPNRRMADLRRQRDALLVETDYMGNSDVVMSEDWVTYRQALRDITTQTPSDDALSNITFPTKPTE